MGSFAQGIPQQMLDSLPPEMLASLGQLTAGRQGRGYPEAFLDEQSPPVAHVEYARVVSAPMSWMTYRGTREVYCRICGLTSDRGRAMNGKYGWVVKAAVATSEMTPDARLRVLYVEDATEPGPLEEARGAPSAREAGLKCSNLRLARVTASADPPPGRTLLSALAGDVDGAGEAPAFEPGGARPSATGFFVFYPGLRLGPDRCFEFAALHVDVAKLGNWGSAMSPAASEADVAAELQRMKASKGLEADAWDPLGGPGWPGVYTDKRARGVREAAAEDVVECASAAEAWGLWAEIEQRARANQTGGTRGAMGSLRLGFAGGGTLSVGAYGARIPYLAPMRARLALGATDRDWRDALEWLLHHSHLGRGQMTSDMGVGLLGAYVVRDGDVATGVGIFSMQGNFAPSDFVNNWSAREAHFSVAIRGQRFWLEEGHDAYRAGDAAAEPLEKPRRREWSELTASPCGRYTMASWWRDGSNYDADDDADLELTAGFGIP